MKWTRRSEIDANIRKADTIFAFSVYFCKERIERYFRKNLPRFHFCVLSVCRFYFVVWKGSRQRTRICHVTYTRHRTYRWPHTHNCHVGLIYICYRTNPLASYTSATGNPLASYTSVTGNPLAWYTFATGNPLASYTFATSNPLALFTFATGNPLA